MKQEVIALVIVAVIMLAFVQGVVGLPAVGEFLAAVVGNKAPEFLRVVEMVK